uniref:2IC6 n=1 Tax=chemical production metagenome TaxID=2495586 RepID=UPI002870B411
MASGSHMSTLKEVQDNITLHEQRLVTCRKPLKEIERAVEFVPVPVLKNILQRERACVSALETKLGELKRELADLIAAQKLAGSGW